MKIDYFLDTCKKCKEKHIVFHFIKLDTEDMESHLGWTCKSCGTINKLAFAQLQSVDRDS